MPDDAAAPPDTEPIPYLVGHVQQALAHDPRVNEMNVSVTVAGRKIWINGTVATVERQQAVADVVRDVAPGYEVRNDTSVYCLTEATEPEAIR